MTPLQKQMNDIASTITANTNESLTSIKEVFFGNEEDDAFFCTSLFDDWVYDEFHQEKEESGFRKQRNYKVYDKIQKQMNDIASTITANTNESLTSIKEVFFGNEEYDTFCRRSLFDDWFHNEFHQEKEESGFRKRGNYKVYDKSFEEDDDENFSI